MSGSSAMWNLLFYVKADQTGWEHSYCVDQVLRPLISVRERLAPGVRDVVVPSKRSQAGYFRRQPLPTGTSPWVQQATYWAGTRRFNLSEAPSLEAVVGMDGLRVQDMASAEAIAAYLCWALKDQPREAKAALVLWGHGAAFYSPFLHLEYDPCKFNFGELLENLPSIEYPDFPPAPKDATEDGIPREGDLPFEGRLHSLPELGRGLKSGLERAGRRKLDVLGFNSCFMACIEAAYELREHAHFMVGSEEETPFEGWHHAAWVGEVGASRESSAEDVARIMVRTYEAGAAAEKTISAIRLGAGIDALTGCIRAFVGRAASLDRAQWLQVVEARRHTAQYGRFGGSMDVLMVDIVHFFQEVELRCPAMADAARAVSHACAGVVVVADAGPARRGRFGSHGLSIFFPEARGEFERLANRDRYNPGGVNSPSFVAASGWREFLEGVWRVNGA